MLLLSSSQLLAACVTAISCNLAVAGKSAAAGVPSVLDFLAVARLLLMLAS